MGVRFVLGLAGTGKTRWCMDRIGEMCRQAPLGPPIIWLVPRQATFQIDRLLTSVLGGYARVTVTSFDRLVWLATTQARGSARPQVNGVGRRIILGHLLRKRAGDLKYFGKVADKAGLAASIEMTLLDLERSGYGPDEILRLGGQDGFGDVLPAKLEDLRLIYADYLAFLGEERIDPAARLRQSLDLLESSKMVQGATAFVDGFQQFDHGQRQVMVRLASACESLSVTFCLDPDSRTLDVERTRPTLLDEADPFFAAEEACRRLRRDLTDAGIAVESAVRLTRSHRFATPTLVAIERTFAERTATPPKTADGLVLLEAVDRDAEVDAAARYVRSLAHDGMRYRDIAVLARNLDAYRERIRTSFAEHDIPFFMDDRRSMSHHPLVLMVRGIIALARDGWQSAQVIALAKTGLAGIDLEQADRLESFAQFHRLYPAAWTQADDWAFTVSGDPRRADPEVDEAPRMDKLRRGLVDKLEPFLKSSRRNDITVRDLTAELFATLDRFDVPRQLADWISKAGAEEAAEHRQAWNSLTALADQMVDLVGDEPTTLEEYAQVLDAALEGFQVALTPPTLDQVTVGRIDRSRPQSPRAVVLLGMVEGDFPAAATEDSILTDREREELRGKGVEVFPESRRRLVAENALAYLAFTRASERLYISRPLSDERGRPRGPSPYWRRVQRLFPGLKILCLPRDPADVRSVGTPRQLVSSLLSGIRLGRPLEGPWATLYEFVRESDRAAEVARLRDLAWDSLRYDNAARLDPSLAERLFASPQLRASVSQLEALAACPFKHFAAYGLRLGPAEDEQPNALDMGTLCHGTLELLARRLLNNGRHWGDLDDKEIAEMVRVFALQVADGIRGRIMLSEQRNQYLLARMRKTLERVVRHQRAFARRCGFHTHMVEQNFGRENSPMRALKVLTPKGRTLYLRGKIDRIDVLGKAAFIVVDYKLRRKKLSLDEVAAGTALQLLTYVLAVREELPRLLKSGSPLTPAGAFYIEVVRALEKIRLDEDLPDPDREDFDLRVKPMGVFDRAFTKQLDTRAGPNDTSLPAQITQGGEAYRRWPAVEREHLERLLDFIKSMLGTLGDQLADGDVSVYPYYVMGKRTTPCSYCEFGSVCRIEPQSQKYRIIPRDAIQALGKAAQQ